MSLVHRIHSSCILFFALMMLLFIVACDEDDTNTKAKSAELETELQPDQISWNIKAIFVDSSYTKAILYANKARIYQDRMETLLDSGLKVEFLSRESGNRISLLTAETAQIDDRTKNMIARGNVVVTSDSSGRKLETSILSWDNATQRFYSTEFVRISSTEETLQGYGFESDPNLNNYKILRVSGEKR